MTHTHTCDRSPRHIGVHRDVQQKGDHTCEWDTPGPKDMPALLAEVKQLREAGADADAWRAMAYAEIVRLRRAWDDLNYLRLDERDCPEGHRETLRAAIAERDQTALEIEGLRAAHTRACNWEANLAASLFYAQGAARTAQAEVAALRSERDTLLTQAVEQNTEMARLVEQVDQLRAERGHLASQVNRVRARHSEQCGGVCAAEQCECEPGDLLCVECETPHPCPTIRDLAGEPTP
ncbi:hypothetical protein [Spirillospora sp. NBC_01491]|uniref:hypothetical protein n=1 Tax=Spirillospora sp. NBC_01491 TaxID=2976007 RepID=UPI002E36FC73|nr:hypothetical protein [Spirillospora sp. NBC_01491]